LVILEIIPGHRVLFMLVQYIFQYRSYHICQIQVNFGKAYMFAVDLGGKVVHACGNMVNKWHNMQTVLAMPVLYLVLAFWAPFLFLL